MIVYHTKTYKDREFPITSDISDFIDRLKAACDRFYPASPYLFPDDSKKNGVISNKVVYRLYERMCKKLDIECNASGGNIYLASVLYGNSPQSASRHYYTGIDLSEAKALLECNNLRVTKNRDDFYDNKNPASRSDSELPGSK